MTENINHWLKTTKIIIYKNSKKNLGNSYKWIFLATIMPLIWPIMASYYLHNISEEYSGSIPVTNNNIKAIGYFEKNCNDKTKISSCDFYFITKDGKRYPFFKSTTMSSLNYLTEKPLPTYLFIEGFLLQDGKGKLYPLKMQSLDGVEIESSARLLKILTMWRNPYAIEKIKIILYPELALLLVSILAHRKAAKIIEGKINA